MLTPMQDLANRLQTAPFLKSMIYLMIIMFLRAATRSCYASSCNDLLFHGLTSQSHVIRVRVGIDQSEMLYDRSLKHSNRGWH